MIDLRACSFDVGFMYKDLTAAVKELETVSREYLHLKVAVDKAIKALSAIYLEEPDLLLRGDILGVKLTLAEASE